MPDIWLTSDTHYHHENSWKTFKRADGSPLRPFGSTEEMNETMVQRWNEVVRPNDKVYHLGDVTMGRPKDADRNLPILARLMGKKRLVMGNHDMLGLTAYSVYFEEIYGVRVLEDMILSHVPLRPENITERWNVNIHGHLHDKTIPNGLYNCVCVEQTDFRPINLEEVRRRVKLKREQYPVTFPKYNKSPG